MQPSPMAETWRLLHPSWRCCLVVLPISQRDEQLVLDLDGKS
jgi:hypothetical protein